MRRRLIIACAVAAATGGHAFVVLNSPGPRRAALRQQPPPPLRRRRALVAPRHRGPCAPLQGASPPSLEPPSVAAHDSPPPPPPPHGGGLSEDDGAAVLVAEGGTGAPHYDDGGERGEWPRLEDAHSSSSSSSSSTTTTTTRDSSSTTATPADDAVAGRGKEEDAAVALAYGGVLSFPATLPFAGPIAKKLEDPRFEVVLFAVVLISCLLFALETLPMEREVLDTIDTLQDNVSTLFALEFALKWYAQFGLRFTSLFEPVRWPATTTTRRRRHDEPPPALDRAPPTAPPHDRERTTPRCAARSLARVTITRTQRRPARCFVFVCVPTESAASRASLNLLRRRSSPIASSHRGIEVPIRRSDGSAMRVRCERDERQLRRRRDVVAMTTTQRRADDATPPPPRALP